MADDPLTALERELVWAAERRGPILNAPPARRRPMGIGTAAAMVAALVPVLAVVAGVIMIRGHSSSPPAVGADGAATSLTRILGVLRRPQRPLDLGRSFVTSEASVAARHRDPRFTLERSLLRRVDFSLAGPGSHPVVRQIGLMVVRTHTARPQQRIGIWAYPNGIRISRPTSTSELVTFWSPSTFASAAQLQARGVIQIIGQDSLTDTDVAVVVPDGVSVVALSSPGGSSVPAHVHDNVAAFRVPGTDAGQIQQGSSMTWFGPGGRVIRRVAPEQSARSTLTALLPVLRRPQTRADRDPAVLRAVAGPRATALYGTADRPLVRLAATTPWGARVFLVPALHPKPAVGAAVAVYVSRYRSAWFPAAVIQAGQAVLATSPMGAPLLPPRGSSNVIAVVPGGVARVVFSFPRGLALPAAVHGDIAAARTTDPRYNIGQASMSWYSSAGQLIRRIRIS